MKKWILLVAGLLAVMATVFIWRGFALENNHTAGDLLTLTNRASQNDFGETVAAVEMAKITHEKNTLTPNGVAPESINSGDSDSLANIEAKVFTKENALFIDELQALLEKHSFAEFQQALLNQYSEQALKDTAAYRKLFSSSPSIRNGEEALRDVGCSERLCAISIEYGHKSQVEQLMTEIHKQHPSNGVSVHMYDDTESVKNFRLVMTTSTEFNSIVTRKLPDEFKSSVDSEGEGGD